MDATKSAKCCCKCFGKVKTIYQHFIHFLTRIPLPQEGFLPKSFVRGHGRCWSAHPRPPWPRGAARRPNRRPSRLRSAAVCRLGSRGPRPSPQAEPNGTKGKKTLRKFWHLKNRKFWKLCAIQTIDLRNIANGKPLSIEAMSAMSAVKMTWINSKLTQTILQL